MSEISAERLREIYEECGSDLVKVADRVGVPYAELSEKFGAELPSTIPRRRRQPPADVGHRPGWPAAKHIVASRHCDNPVWPDQDRIDAARRKYEMGTHELCTGRDRGWFVLFCVPRVKRCSPRKFFVTH